MKVFIWENVLTDYSPGMAVGYGETLEEVLEKFPEYIAEQLGRPSTVINCNKRTKPFAAYVYGGG